MAPKKKLPLTSPKGSLVQWRGHFYSRKDFVKVVLGSLGASLLSRKALAVPLPFNFLKGGGGHGSLTSTVNSSWAVPSGVTSITVEVWGGGGGGGANVSGSCRGRPGNAGVYKSQVVAVSAGQGFNWTIGGGGGSTGAGGTTTCSRTTPAVSVSAAGGSPGANAASWNTYRYYTTYRNVRGEHWAYTYSGGRWYYTYHGQVTGHTVFNGRAYYCPNGAAGSGAIGSGGSPGAAGVGGQVKITW